MPKLYFRYGVMNSSKTANLLMVAHNYTQQDKKILLLKPCLDTRYKQTSITSRIGIEKEVDILLEDDTDLLQLDLDLIQCILVDECQFLTSKHVDQLRILTLKVPVICYGLRTDSATNLFEGSKRLMELSDSIEEIKSTCSVCDKKAIVNAKYILDDEIDRKIIVKTIENQIDIGAEDKYTALCWQCWNKA